MKSLSIKTLILALVVVGSANAGFIDSIQDSLEAADHTIFGKLTIKRSMCLFSDGFGKEISRSLDGGLPGFRNIRPESGYIRAATFAAVVTGAAVAVRAAYKHFTKPAVEADNAEANVEAAQ